MWNAHLCGIVILTLLVTIANTHGYYAPTLSGILKLAANREDKFSSCHDCLLQHVGINELQLLVANSDFKIYWVQGHTGLQRAFKLYCISRKKCIISKNREHGYASGDLMRKHVSHEESVIVIEDSLSLFVSLINHSTADLVVTESHAHTESWKHVMFSSIRKRVWRIPLFLSEKSIPKFCKLGAINQHVSDSSLRCMIIPLFAQEGTCLECMAMHGKMSEIRTYIFFQDSFKTSAKLCVFPFDETTENIIKNCKNTFCREIMALPASNCNQWDKFFVNHNQISKWLYLDQRSSETSPKLSGVNWKWIDPRNRDVEKVVEHIALKRMSRSSTKYRASECSSI